MLRRPCFVGLGVVVAWDNLIVVKDISFQGFLQQFLAGRLEIYRILINLFGNNKIYLINNLRNKQFHVSISTKVGLNIQILTDTFYPDPT